ASLVATQFAAIFVFSNPAVLAVRHDQIDVLCGQTLPQRIPVIASVCDDPRGQLGKLGHSSLQQLHLRRRGRFDQGRQRNSLAACHQNALCTFSTLGVSDARAPFFAGANVASAKVSSQLSRPCSSSSSRNACHMLTHTSASSQSRNRRQQVLGEGYSRD